MTDKRVKNPTPPAEGDRAKPRVKADGSTPKKTPVKKADTNK